MRHFGHAQTGRIESGRDHRQPCRGSGHDSVPQPERRQRQQLAVHQRNLHRRRPGRRRDQLGEPGQPGANFLPRRSRSTQLLRGTRSAAASVCSRANACNGARVQIVVNEPSAAATRRAPASTGSVTDSESVFKASGAPSSAADARAALTDAAAAVLGHPVRLAG